MPSTETRVDVAVALVYQAEALHQHLRSALSELGAQVVYETRAAAFDRGALDRSGARVVVVNLDPESDEPLDHLDDLLVDDARKVVFNDGEVTSQLTGWDLARWARHLASKIVGETDLLPPRPAGAESVPVRNMPQYELSSSAMPASVAKPAVSDSAMLAATDEIANALAAFDLQGEKMAAARPVSAPLPAPVAPANRQDILGDFGLDVVSTPAASAGSGLSLDDLAFELPDSADNPFGGLDFDAPAASVPADLASDLLAFADQDFSAPAPRESVPDLDDLLASAPRESSKPASPAPAARAEPVPAAPKRNLLEGLSLSLEPIDEAGGAPPATPVASANKPAPAAPVAAAAKSPFDDLGFSLDGLSLEPFDLDAEPAKPAVTGASAPKPPSSPAASSPAATPALDPFADLTFSLEPLDLDADAPTAAPTAAPKSVAPAPKLTPDAAANSDSPFADLDFNFDLDKLDSNSFTAAPVVDPAALDASAEEDAFLREFAAMSSQAKAETRGAAVNTGSGTLGQVFVLGASIGGPDAVREFIHALPAGIPACFVLAQHMGADFIELMMAQLQKATPMRVLLAEHGASASAGQILVVPIGERMLLEPSGAIRVVPLDEASPYSPSIDRVLIDVADRFGAMAGAIIFSGMAHDAIEGAKHLAALGGQVWVQDPSTCVVSSMIDGAMEAGIVSFVGTPSDLAREFARRYGKH